MEMVWYGHLYLCGSAASDLLLRATNEELVARRNIGFLA